MNIKKFLPKTFFGRALTIIVVPMLILQTVLTYFFMKDIGKMLEED